MSKLEKAHEEHLAAEARIGEIKSAMPQSMFLNLSPTRRVVADPVSQRVQFQDYSTDSHRGCWLIGLQFDLDDAKKLTAFLNDALGEQEQKR